VKPNTHIVLQDGREATVVWHWLNGYGIKWGHHTFDVDDLPEPDALLREPHRSIAFPGIECVGEAYRVAEGADSE
jgi:hypothetical protein